MDHADDGSGDGGERRGAHRPDDSTRPSGRLRARAVSGRELPRRNTRARRGGARWPRSARGPTSRASARRRSRRRAPARTRGRAGCASTLARVSATTPVSRASAPGRSRDAHRQAHEPAVLDEAALDDARHDVDVDVAAGQHQRHASCRRGATRSLTSAASGDGARALGDGLLALEQEQDGVGDLLLVDGDDLVDVAARRAEACARRRGAPRCRRRSWCAAGRSTGAPAPSAALHAGQRLASARRSTRIAGLVSFTATAMPADEPAAADRDHDGLEVGHLLEQLEADGALAGDHARRRRTGGRTTRPRSRLEPRGAAS